MNDSQHITKLRKEVRLLQVIVLICISSAGILWFGGFKDAAENKKQYDEITVERINIVEPDGTLKLVISNSERQAEATIGGEELPIERTRPAGMLFFNDYGDEVGGLVFEGDRSEGGIGMMFDQAGQDQVIGLQNLEWTDEEGSRRRQTGLNLWDRPKDLTIIERIEKVQKAEALETQEERDRAMTKLREEGVFGAHRGFIGRTAERETIVNLKDENGNARLQLAVEQDGIASIKFLDEDGEVIRTIGAKDDDILTK